MASSSPTTPEVGVAPADQVPVAAAPAKPSVVSQEDWQRQLWLLLPVALVGFLYWKTFVKLYWVWELDENYSHGFVVPVFSLGMMWVAWTRHEQLAVQKQTGVASLINGVALATFGWILHLVSVYAHLLLLDVLALICILCGVVLALGGKKAGWAYAFPIFFLLCKAPLPLLIYKPLALKMQYMVAVVATEMLDTVGVTAFRDGFNISLAHGLQMNVAEACSGIRGLTAIMALAAAVGYLSGRSFTYRWILAFLSIPIALISNCLRVFATGLIMINLGPEWATGDAHEAEGMIVIGIAALVTVGVAWLLAALEDWYRETPEDSLDGDAAAKAADPPDALETPTGETP